MRPIGPHVQTGNRVGRLIMSKKTKDSDKTYNFRYLSLCAIILALAVVFGLLNNKFFVKATSKRMPTKYGENVA